MKSSDLLLGALVADAACMGLHWMYDVEHIDTLEQGGDLLFRPADGNAYVNRRGAFVHAGKRAGELSHYGESARLVHEVLLSGSYSTAAHRDAFMATFGPCGSYCGYADRPTKSLIARMLGSSEPLVDPSGMDDNQMPAFCVLPAMAAVDADPEDILLAAKVISINEDVLAGIETVCSLIQYLKTGESLDNALHKAAHDRSDAIGQRLQKSLAIPDYQPVGIGDVFGRACYAHDALPVVWHLLQHASDYESVVRDNVRCGGDSCGRAMVLGSIAGMVFGIPAATKRRLARGALPSI